MAMFRYRLETLLRVRENEEEQCRQQLAHEIYVLGQHREYLERLRGERDLLRRTLEEKQGSGITAAANAFYSEAIANKERMIAFQKNAVAAQEKMVETVREQLVARVKARQIVERLKEKEYLEWRREEARKEQNDNDEQAVLRHGRAVLRHGRAVLRHGRGQSAEAGR